MFSFVTVCYGNEGGKKGCNPKCQVIPGVRKPTHDQCKKIDSKTMSFGECGCCPEIDTLTQPRSF